MICSPNSHSSLLILLEATERGIIIVQSIELSFQPGISAINLDAEISPHRNGFALIDFPGESAFLGRVVHEQVRDKEGAEDEERRGRKKEKRFK